MRILGALVAAGRPMGTSEIADAIDWERAHVHKPLVALENAKLVTRAGTVLRTGRPGRAAVIWAHNPVAAVIVRLPALPEREQIRLIDAMVEKPDRSAGELAQAVGATTALEVSGRLRRMRERGMVDLAESKGAAVRWRWRLANGTGA